LCVMKKPTTLKRAPPYKRAALIIKALWYKLIFVSAVSVLSILAIKFLKKKILAEMVIKPIIGKIGLNGAVVAGLASKNIISRFKKIVTKAKSKTPLHKAR